ncbi:MULTISPECIES: helix-turn-helix transcriptional regulator [unclassified Streptomyces]|uniref:helix-turn-helix transcriptional regulator n=1 Tax=unclassified Streptomyces TaxID=2593676 RepID=UPI000BACDDE1|nr:helix-turn-helix transcriptional regulator [Streptomyces sp. CLI2509]ASY33321.1 AraC family transcriptional regulator [Streptomyces sp. CLI2509]MYX23129.1 helix-turn-helix domain-containing protein [Streptomyces sp. SID8380]
MPGAVLWSRRQSADAHVRVLPDACMDLMWAGGRLLVAGPDTTAHVTPVRAGEVYEAVRFPPGAAPSVLGVPAGELRDLRVPLADLWPQRRARELAERVGESADRAASLEAVAASALYGRIARDRVPEAVLAGLRRGLAVADLARELALSERHLRRRCLDAFGYGPKTLARILRLGRALDRARTGLPFAQVAHRTGYADQAHLAREVRALTGLPLGHLLAEENR